MLKSFKKKVNVFLNLPSQANIIPVTVLVCNRG